MIYLCGAGCGDWEWMTLRAMRMIQKADCILYDRLIDPQIIRFAPAHCECIYVGKQADHHTMAQKDIQKLLIEKGRQYETVVRLKGGDPCVFGRGGEEAEALVEAGLPFEIIPGISSGIGGLAAAGIPVTHRAYTSGVRLLSAYGKDHTRIDLDFAAMAHTKDTLVFYMGLSQLSYIVRGLLDAGMDGHTPIALVSNAGRNCQTMVCATLQDIEKQDVSAICSPALIVVGAVVSLHEKLYIQTQKPLFQKRFLLPQFQSGDHSLALQLKDLGAMVDCIVCGRIEANPTLYEQVDWQQVDVLVFTSRNAIDLFFAQMKQHHQDIRMLAAMTIAVIGRKSAAALQRYGIMADLCPEKEDSEHLAQTLRARISQDTKIVILKAENENTVLYEALRHHAQVQVVAAYSIASLAVALPDVCYDGVLFTCSHHVHACIHQINKQQDITMLRMYSMGSHTTRALRSYGCKHIIELPKADKDLFVDCIVKEESHV